ncbi:hypothetical protein HYFRA_00006418 [Hymenoscyphus fraxineus]|uniref:Uncharacterized protein n=1 Tax=Hymenoscyphus fraxineus TaxID=746836 RepID=A0A9N9PLE0_9HELO|nr:hypothetical protein HYFRA_00006418 [Hymenoscyphus fraxineus]
MKSFTLILALTFASLSIASPIAEAQFNLILEPNERSLARCETTCLPNRS